MQLPRFATSRLPFLLLTATLTLAACGDDEISAPSEPVEGTLTLDASTGWAFARLDPAGPVTVTDPTTSTEWDLAINATAIMLNGGAAGPGGVTGYCLCQNAGATDEHVLAMTADSELADFDAVTSVPGAATFAAERLVPTIDGWLSGSGAAAALVTGPAWLVRLADGTSYAKLRVADIETPSEAALGSLTLEYAVQADDASPLGAVSTLVLTPASPRGDLNTGTAGAGGTDWDVELDGQVLRVNGGVSGTAAAAATPATEPWDDITTAATDPRAYRADAFGGVFSDTPWYRYNLTGDHRISPTFDVYLIRRGTEVYKLQLTGYYGPAGETRQVSFRYAQLAD